MSLVQGHESAPPVEEIRELFHLCQRAEELRNTYIHSSYNRRERFKVSARARDGIRAHREWVDAGLLLDVADYIGYAANELESVPFMLQLADKMTGHSRGIDYYKDESVVASFKFGEIA